MTLNQIQPMKPRRKKMSTDTIPRSKQKELNMSTITLATFDSPSRTSRTIKLRDGRSLGYAEYGDPAGKAVFHFHGSAGSRLERPTDESILTGLGIRYISTDRPGHGLSDPQPDRKLLDWPDDISQLADHLDIARFYVMGWSAGGPYALACASKLPERVLAGAIVSGLAPPDRPNPYEGLPFPNRILMFVFRRMPRLVHLFRRMGFSVIKGAPEDIGKKLASSLAPADRKLIEVPENQGMFVADIREGYRQGWQGPAQDDIITNKPWGFRLEDIAVRIDIWQGEVDENVPLYQGQYQHEKIPNSRLAIWPGQAHVAVLGHWREVLAALVE
jgi:pimeloyl-ACP methyl ester carboxylesterase